MTPQEQEISLRPGNRKLILASNSPRRRDLMLQAGFDFVIELAEVDEDVILERSIREGKHAFEAAKDLALAKARQVFERHSDDVLVLAADTIVCLDDAVLGKPEDDDEALSMLEQLSGRTHQVATGFAILGEGFTLTDVQVTDVTFNVWDSSQEAIAKRYISMGYAKDKAGAYGIQDFAGLLVREIRGDYSNVVGLPISAISRRLWALGLGKH